MTAIEIKLDLAFMDTKERLALFRHFEYRERKKLSEEKKQRGKK